jgi:hypothetical protein
MPCILITRDYVPRWWNSARVLLLMVVVVRGSPRIHVRANGCGRVCDRVVERRRTNVHSYVPSVLILILALARGLRVAREGIVGRGRVSE